MSLWRRFLAIFNAKAYKAVNAMEKVDETVDFAYAQQQEQLLKVKRGIADLVTAKKQIEMRATAQQTEIDKLDGQARQALQQGREDLAREALTRKTAAQHMVADLQSQVTTLAGQEQKLIDGQQQLETKISQFRTQKEVIKAQYSAAEAQVRIGEAATGISGTFTDTGLAIGRAQEKVEQMQARASAIDELTAAGALEDFTGGGDDRITRELNLVTQSKQVDDELAKLKGEVEAAPEKKELETAKQ